jgi:hypothetical protein
MYFHGDSGPIDLLTREKQQRAAPNIEHRTTKMKREE